MKTNYFYLKNGIRIQGLGIILAVKDEFLKIQYSIELGLFKILKEQYQFLRNDVVAISLPKLKFALKTEIISAWREFIDIEDNQLNADNLKIKQSLVNNFNERIFTALIPETSLNPLRYVSGMAALNLHIFDSCSGDWHFSGTYHHHFKLDPYNFLYGENCRVNNNFIFGNIEIIEVGDIIRKKLNINFIGEKCYMATHCRAVADLVIHQVLNDKALNDVNIDYCNHINLAYVDEFLFTTEEQLRAIELVKIAFPYLNDYQKELVKDWCEFRVYSVR